MGSLRHRMVVMAEQAAPRGRLRWLDMRTSADQLMTLAIGLAALALSLAYQILVRRRPGGPTPQR